MGTLDEMDRRMVRTEKRQEKLKRDERRNGLKRQPGVPNEKRSERRRSR